MINPGLTPMLLALQSPTGSGGVFTPYVIQAVALSAIIYFLIIRPQQTQKRKQEETLRGLKRGDQIVTFGGIIGEVIHVKESVTEEGARSRFLEDQITIKSAESRLIVERGRIARVSNSGTAAT